MIGPKYWSTGIVIKYHDPDRWTAEADFFDDGWCDSESSEGQIRARYQGPLETVVDVVKADAERLGIEWRNPTVYYPQDGEGKDAPPDACTIADEQARRIGWRAVYGQLASKQVPA